jgi:sensor histidine kinase regulating citrate/malate metabolism
VHNVHTGVVRPRRWSLARQLLALQVALVALLVAAGAVAAYVDARHDSASGAAEKVLAVARTVAAEPAVLAAVRFPDPAAALQPRAERVRRATGVDFVVVMGRDRTRYSHPDPAQIGRPFIGTIAPALRGRAFTETYTGTLGPSVRAVAPVRDTDGRVAALVAVGITRRHVSEALAAQLPALLGVAALALVLAVLGSALVSRRLRRQTHGLGPEEITRMYEYYDAVLHSIREGLLLLDHDRRLVLANDEARRLLGDAGTTPRRRPEDLDLPAPLAALLASGRGTADELHLTDERVLVVSQRPASWQGRNLGTVVTLRDHTELQALTGELDSVRGFAEALRSQAHEAGNRLHTVVSLIGMGRAEEAADFAIAELRQAQQLTDQLLDAVGEPVLAALLLGKAAQAHERGVELAVTPDTAVGAAPVEARDLVTVVGNLVDNAIDAALGAPPPRWVEVTVLDHDEELLVRVVDSGPGLDPSLAERAFSRGWSTKDTTAPHGRGLGLALVGQVVARHAGRIDVTRDEDGGAVFTVRLPHAHVSGGAR